MPLLLYTAILLFIIVLIAFLINKKCNYGRNLLVITGIFIGLSVLGLYHLSDNAFGASTPVKIQTENLTDKNLKIYAIRFSNNKWKEKGSYVYYAYKLKPNKKSDFWIDYEHSYFWLVAKNEKNEIEYLKVVTEYESKFEFKIIENEILNQENIEIAKQLTQEADKRKRIERIAIWANSILIGLLIFSLIKRRS